MSEQRFVLKFDSQENEYFIRDNFEEEEELGSYTLKWGVRKLNEQQDIIDKLDQENADLLGARIKAQEEWEKCTDKLKAKILEQQSIIEAKDKEIEESKITIQLYETDVSMRDNFLKSKGLYDEFLQCILE